MIGERPSHQQLNLSFDASCGVQNGLAGRHVLVINTYLQDG